MGATAGGVVASLLAGLRQAGVWTPMEADNSCVLVFVFVDGTPRWTCLDASLDGGLSRLRTSPRCLGLGDALGEFRC